MDKGSLKVLHLISGLGIGGAERLLLWAARYHDRERYPLGIISLMSDGELAGDIRETGVPVMEMHQKRGRFTISAFKDLLSRISDIGPLILQGHMFHSNLLARLARSALPREGKVINTVHIEWEPWYRRFLYAATTPFADGYITFSTDARRVYTEPGPRNRPVKHIPYGIEVKPSVEGNKGSLRRRVGLPLEGPLWISVGRLSRQKAYTNLIEAFSLLDYREPEASLVIAGEGEDRPILEKLICDKGLANRVHLLGVRFDVPLLLAACDAFVLSSSWEGNPLVLLEAMAAALPVVSTDVGMVSTMAVDGETAFLVPPGSPRDLAAAMDRLMDMGPEAARLGAAGRKRLEKYYDYRRMHREMESFYSQLLGRHEGVGT